jgi:hypothetical protein
MPGPLKNARHEKFAQEYLADLNAFRAAAACDIEFKAEGSGYYVYFLIDQRSGRVFYVGKGKGHRLHMHRKQAHDPASINQVKAARIRECGSQLAEVIFADELDEVTAFRVEKEFIRVWRHVGLTNISAGSVHPMESLLAGIDRSMGLIREFDEWMANATPRQIEATTRLAGSPEAFYREFWQHFYDIRADVVQSLNSIKEKSNGTSRR